MPRRPCAAPLPIHLLVTQRSLRTFLLVSSYSQCTRSVVHSMASLPLFRSLFLLRFCLVVLFFFCLSHSSTGCIIVVIIIVRRMLADEQIPGWTVVCSAKVVHVDR
jgi:hypothetical protein